jgi:hypothetical protein
VRSWIGELPKNARAIFGPATSIAASRKNAGACLGAMERDAEKCRGFFCLTGDPIVCRFKISGDRRFPTMALSGSDHYNMRIARDRGPRKQIPCV